MANKNTIKPAYRKIEERYYIGTSYAKNKYTISYKDNSGYEVVKISDNIHPPWWFHSSLNKNSRVALPNDLELTINKLPLHVRKVMGRTK